MYKCVAIIQARTGSTRLPGKSLAHIAGKPLLAHIIERLRYCKEMDKIVIATTYLVEDWPIVALGDKLGVPVVTGHVEDVLARFFLATGAYGDGAGTVVRVCGDSPAILPDFIDDMIRMHRDGGYDHCHLSGYPDGADAEALTFDALKQAYMNAKLPSEREHVTSWIWKQPERFKLGKVECPIAGASKYRLCVDDLADLDVVRAMYEKIYDPDKPFDLQDIIGFCESHPNLMALNQDTPRNAGYIKSIADECGRLGKQELELLGVKNATI